MNKAIILFALLVAIVSCIEARERCARICKKDDISKVRCIRDGRICRKIRQCSLDEENCRRRLKGLPALTTTCLSACRNISPIGGSGLCAPIRKPRGIPRNCNEICRDNPGDKPMCYRSKKNNNCRRLTPCQMNRLNCKRGVNNRLEWIDSRACGSLRVGDSKRKCLAVPRG